MGGACLQEHCKTISQWAEQAWKNNVTGLLATGLCREVVNITVIYH